MGAFLPAKTVSALVNRWYILVCVLAGRHWRGAGDRRRLQRRSTQLCPTEWALPLTAMLDADDACNGGSDKEGKPDPQRRLPQRAGGDDQPAQG